MKKIVLLSILLLTFILAACGETTNDREQNIDDNGYNQVIDDNNEDDQLINDDTLDDEDDDNNENGQSTNDDTLDDEDDDVVDEEPNDGLLKLTLDQLSEFDGREGRRAFIAVDGIIYEVTNSPRWPNGNHNGHQAGQDFTAIIDSISPHGRDVLSRLPIVGTLIED